LPNYKFENKDGKWTKTAHPLDSLFYSVLLYNTKDKTYWAGLRKELRHYDDQFRLIRSYGRQDGYGTLILNMLMDNNDNIWFVNQSKRVGQLNMTTGIISFLSESDGYYKQEYEWFIPSAKDAKENIYFGVGATIGAPSVPPHWGLDRINPNLYSSVVTSSVYLRSIFVNQKPYSLNSDPELFEELLLKYNQNSIRIDAGIIDFFSNQKGQIRYKLERSGKAGEWEYSLDHTIRYEDLPPGSYRLTVQAANGNNEFNSPVKTFNIRISPPFWQTWWFRILAAIFVIAVIYGIIQYRSRSLKKQNILLEEKVLTRTKELKHSLENLREAQKQLVQSEKMASLGELTAGIAHEIQNPLNFVNNFSEVSNELIDEMKAELDNGDTNEAKNIADEVKQNLEKILHHGKRADGIVKGMLQHSRTSSGQKEPTDINALADEYLRLAYHGLRAKDKSFNAKFESDFDNSIGKLNIISQDIGRVILNLINNAFYAVTEKKSSYTNASLDNNYEPIVTVSTKRLGSPSGDGGKIEIRVADNGNGIPQKILDKIFQPFFTTKPTGQGTGLGLSLSYDIVKAHGGELKVETKEGEGTVFVIYLPS
jgi:signal transduction histidine kinase